ncbi:MAG: helix-turn-helix domain-containing protein [Clostridia bacterium]|nr:helix-turn-helix domain-containing protein [Oscillospiraceae bacterium]MBQ7032295.1 helix-turn-helix domain-containing protein [Clostridia bacterium]
MLYSVADKKDDVLFLYNRRLHEKPISIPLHYHDWYEFFMLLSGSATYTVDGNRYALEPFDLIFTNNLEVHFPEYHDGTQAERICVSFTPQFIPFVITEEYNPFSVLGRRKLGTSNKIPAEIIKKAGVHEDLIQIGSLCETDTPASRMQIRLVFANALLKVADNFGAASAADFHTHALVSEVVKYIDSHISEDLRHKTICDAFYISANHLQHIFREQTGYTLSDYIRLKRILHVQSMIAGGVSATEAAASAGFKDYTTFYRSFKSVTGTTPRKFSAATNF